MHLKIILVPTMDWRYTGVIYLYFITLNSTDTSSTVRSWLSMVRCLEIGFHAQLADDLAYLRCRPTIVTYFNCVVFYSSRLDLPHTARYFWQQWCDYVFGTLSTFKSTCRRDYWTWLFCQLLRIFEITGDYGVLLITWIQWYRLVIPAIHSKKHVCQIVCSVRWMW